MNIYFKFINLLLLTVIIGCEKATVNNEAPLRPVRTIVIEHPNSKNSMQYSAVVDASQKADLSFKVSGELVESFVNQGDEVKKGQILARLNDKDLKILLEEAKSSFDKAKGDYDRGISLAEKNVISKSELDKLKAQFSSAKTHLATATNNLEYTNLHASFDGVIARKYSENFQEVSAKQPIFALNNIDEIYLKINIPESVIIQIPRDGPNRKITATFDEIPDVSFPAEFKEVSLQADEITKTYEVTFSMKAPTNHTVLPGMTATIIGTKRESIADDKKRFILPSNTVLKDVNGNYVFIVESIGENKGRIKKMPVEIGEITSQGIEVYSGVMSGQHLVTAGVTKVAEGMLVKFSL